MSYNQSEGFSQKANYEAHLVHIFIEMLLQWQRQKLLGYCAMRCKTYLQLGQNNPECYYTMHAFALIG